MIHGPHNIKLITAQQAKNVHTYENIMIKLYKCNAAIWYNNTYQICNIQLENAPEDGPLRSETCRATKCYEYTQS